MSKKFGTLPVINIIKYKSLNHLTKLKKINPKKFEEKKCTKTLGVKSERNEKINQNFSSSIYMEEKKTKKIDYRYNKEYPLSEIIPLQFPINASEKKLYWFVAYDKYMNTKKIKKILMNNDNKEDIINKPLNSEKEIIVKCRTIEDYEIFFVDGYEKPFVRPKKGSFIFVKMYLLTLKEINKVFNFLNRTDNHINVSNNNSHVKKRNSYKLINNKNAIDGYYPYCYIFYIGQYMNKSMYLFTNLFTNGNIPTINNNLNLKYSLPNDKKLYKLIKLVIENFPDYKLDTLINCFIKEELYPNWKEKKEEMMKFFSYLNKSEPNISFLKYVLRETIKNIGMNSSSEANEKKSESKKKKKDRIVGIEIINSVRKTNTLCSKKFRTTGVNNTISNLRTSTVNKKQTPNYISSFFENKRIKNNNTKVTEKLNLKLSDCNLNIKKKKDNKISHRNGIILKTEGNKENININNIIKNSKKDNLSISHIGNKSTMQKKNKHCLNLKEFKRTNIEYYTPKKRKKAKYYK